MLHVNFNTYSNYVTDSLYQWDINQDLIIEGLNLMTPPVVHFANSNMNKAIVRNATYENGVITARIPNSLLQDALTIKAYIGTYVLNRFNTIETVEIPVIARERPYDYSFSDDEDEVYSYNALEAKLDNTIEYALARYNDTNLKYEATLAALTEIKKEYDTLVGLINSSGATVNTVVLNWYETEPTADQKAVEIEKFNRIYANRNNTIVYVDMGDTRYLSNMEFIPYDGEDTGDMYFAFSDNGNGNRTNYYEIRFIPANTVEYVNNGYLVVKTSG